MRTLCNKDVIHKDYLLGQVPIGYMNLRDIADRPIALIDTRMAPIIAQLFVIYATGAYSINSLTNLADIMGLRNKHGKPVSKTFISNMLKNSFYCGRMYRQGKLIYNKHQAIISKKLFDRVQEVLDMHSKYVPPFRKW